MAWQKKIRSFYRRISELSHDISGTKAYPFLDYGPIDVEIHGNKYPYCQNMLKQLYKETDGRNLVFTLTPICNYQVRQGWPEPPFVNINKKNSASTTKENWLGYIPIDFSRIDFEQIIKDNGNINVHGHIEKQGRDYILCTDISEKYCILEMHAQMTDRQRDYIVSLAKKIDDYYIVTKPIRDEDGKHYTFYYRDKIPIASASSKKIDNWLKNGEDIAKANLRIHRFRQIYEGATKPYTDVSLIKSFYLEKPR